MKPLKLTLCNFCSYVGENTIDFTKFGGKGIYVITGPKGAGKSTIFDGITFALYGQKSNGLGREDVRSKYASEEGETYAEFEFMYGDKRYVIKRTYKIRRTRTNNLDKSESLEVKEYTKNNPEPRIYPGKTSVLNALIENEIIKLTFDQFTQIVMLVQGDFKKLLIAKNDDKRAIFQKIFNTARFAAYERQFEEKSKQMQVKNKEDKLKFVEKLKQINCPLDYKDVQILEGYRAVDFSDRFKEAIELLQGIIQYQKFLLEQLQMQRDEQYAKAKKYGERKAKAEQQSMLRQAIADLNEQMLREQEPLQAATSALQHINACYEEELDRFSNALASIEEQKLNIKELQEALQKKANVEATLKILNEDNHHLEEGITALQGRLKANEEKLADLEKVLESEDVLTRNKHDLLAQLKHIEATAKQITQLEKRKASLLEEEKALAEKFTESKNSILNQDKLVQEAKQAAIDREKLLNEYKDCEYSLKEVNGILKLFDDYLAAEKEYLKAKDNYNNAFQLMQNQELRYNRLEQIYKDSLAGLWALELKDGAPCPVCGSTQHPQKAELKHEEIHEADVQAAKQELDTLKEKANIAQVNALSKKHEQDRVSAEFKQESKKLYELEDNLAVLERAKKEAAQYAERLEEILVEGKKVAAVQNQLAAREKKLQQLQNYLEELSNKQTQLANKIGLYNGQLESSYGVLRESISKARFADEDCDDKYQDLQKCMPEDRAKLLEFVPQVIDFHQKQLAAIDIRAINNKHNIEARDTLLNANKGYTQDLEKDKEKLAQNNLELGKLEVAVANYQQAVLKLQAKVGEKTSADIISEENAFIQQRQALVNARATAEENFHKLDDAYKAQQVKKKALEDSFSSLTTDGLEIEAADNLAAMQLKAEKEAAAINEKWVNFNTELAKNRDIYEYCKDKTEELEKAAHLSSVWEKLSKLVNGVHPNTNRKSLEVFVQQAHLEKILARAHDKLMFMTDGQYEFKRRPEEERKNKVSGLGIDVVDHTNETIRSVETLSGGESFAAALALSLAVADEIQSSSGGVRLDSMFIDEGFGSLDSDSLNLAMKVLNGLSDNNYLIGIISHVRELEDSVDKKLVVKKSADSDKMSEFEYVL